MENQYRILIWTYSHKVEYHALLETFVFGVQPETPRRLYESGTRNITFDMVKGLAAVSYSELTSKPLQSKTSQ